MRNITPETQSNDPFFSNILDTKQLEDLTNPQEYPRSAYSIHKGKVISQVLDSKWYVRTPLAHGNSISPGDKTRIWLNDIPCKWASSKSQVR